MSEEEEGLTSEPQDVDNQDVPQDFRDVENAIDSMNSDYLGNEIGGQPDANAIKFQIDNEEYMATIERLLRGEVKIRNEITGEEYYGLPKIKINNKLVDDESKKVFNEYGVSQIMNTIHFYVNKHLSLSKFDEKRIYENLKHVCKGLRYHIIANAKKFGLDTEEKMGSISVVVIHIMNVIESSYRRSINGMTLQTINQSTLHSAPTPQGQAPININTGQPERAGIFNPRRWFGRGGYR